MTSTQHDASSLNLVALAAMLLQRWKLMLASSMVIFLPFAAYAMLGLTEQVPYTTLYQLAERDAHTPLRPIADTQYRIENVYARDARAVLSLGLGVTAAHPRNSLLISLRTTAPPGEVDTVRAFHAHIIATMESSDRSRLESVQQAGLLSLSAPPEHADSAWSLDLAGVHEARMGELLVNTTAGQPARRNQPWVWLTLGAILAIISAVISASLASFSSAVAFALKASR